MTYPIYTGDQAREKVQYLLESAGTCTRQYQLRFPADRCCGYFRDGERWVAFDNRSGECFVEEYPSEKLCVKYINYEIP